MDFFVCVGKTNVLMLTLRLRINVQQNPYAFFFGIFHVINEKKVSSYLNNYQGLHDYSGLQSTLKYPKKYVIMFILISVYSYIISSLHI